jgi:HD-GYP domain-containing protein (c-di-GMP phosphodiesterase class II)
MLLADGLSIGLEERRKLYIAANLHDIGKLGVPPGILTKPGRLSPVEFRAIKRHTEIGVCLLNRVQGVWDVLPLVRHHHERYDGNGYPTGLACREIPLGARIIAIADAFDAMTSDRPYQTRKTMGDAFEELLCCAGSQFDPWLVDRFCEGFSKRAYLC